MRVRLLTAIAGAPAYAFGEIAELVDEIALAWIAEGLAERDDAVEIAEDLRPVETAVRSRRRRA
jgi:hypothetical protein